MGRICFKNLVECICPPFKVRLSGIWDDFGIVSVEQLFVAAGDDRFSRKTAPVFGTCNVCHVL